MLTNLTNVCLFVFNKIVKNPFLDDGNEPIKNELRIILDSEGNYICLEVVMITDSFY